ncbi:MAG: flagellar hook-length control protein FliK [Methylococcaceae bacterium]|nr:flagellar hook-length control protein FliK [Methylococcaceae bacterium]
MDIKLPLDVNLQTATTKAANNPLNLKLNQILAAKVVDTQIMLNTLTLNVADKRVSVQTQQPLNLQPGQALQLQVVKMLPVLEFRIVGPASPQAPNQTATQTADALTLKLLSPQTPISANASANLLLNQLAKGQQLQAAIVDIAGNKLTLQLLPAQVPANGGRATPTAAPTNIGNLVITLDTKQLIFTGSGNQAAPSPSPLKMPALELPVLTPGTQINLQVLKTGDPPTFSVSLPVTSTEQKIIELFKQLLPIQTSSAPLLNHLNQILPALENDATIAETLKRLAQEILRSIPLKTQLTEPAQLKQSVDQSGLFLESKLAELLSGKDGTSLQDDLKFKLVKFVHLLSLEIDAQAEQKSAMDNTTVLKEALQKAHAALAKLTLDQFQSLPRDESAKLAWVLELPFFHDQKADTVQIEIERDKQGAQDTDQKNWAVSITITPPELATIHCRISCYDGSVNTRFWSDGPDTVDKINAHLDYLKQQFERNGLKTGFMEAHQGKPTPTDSVKKPLSNLLSEKV